jgi:ABC-2 type transport system ATP-binding protein
VLDEPTVGLDLESRQRFYAALEAMQIKDGFTILWTSHQFDEIERTCTRAVILKDGRVGYDHPLLERNASARILKVRLFLREPHADHSIAAGLSVVNDQQLLFVGECDKFYADILPDVTSRFGLSNLEIIRPSLEEVYLEITNRETEVPTWVSRPFSTVNG